MTFTSTTPTFPIFGALTPPAAPVAGAVVEGATATGVVSVVVSGVVVVVAVVASLISFSFCVSCMESVHFTFLFSLSPNQSKGVKID